MPNYSFDDKQGKSQTPAPESKNIPVEDGEIVFNVGTKGNVLSSKKVQEIKEAEEAQQREEDKTQKNETKPQPFQSDEHFMMDNHQASKPKKKVAAIPQKPTKKPKSAGMKKVGNKIWHILEFVSVTAVIFMVLFFALNYESYSRLFVNKLDQLRGGIQDNPYQIEAIQQEHNASPEGQKPLPIVNSNKAAKQQIPELTLSIAPPDDRVIINRINQNVPVIRVPSDMLIKRNWAALEDQIQEALKFGVVHFPGTALPGDEGNVVITGHSSYFPWDPGRFKDVFALLHQVSVGDEIVVYHDQEKYVYKVYDKQTIQPDQVEVLTQDGEDRLTLITCTPVGTNLRRLVVFAEPV
jgi:LPXTG-site transpeptidase (sortase) family protein